MPRVSPAAARFGRSPATITVTRMFVPLSASATDRRSPYAGAPRPASFTLSARSANPRGGADRAGAGALVEEAQADGDASLAPPSPPPADGVGVRGRDDVATGGGIGAVTAPNGGGRPARPRSGVPLVAGPPPPAAHDVAATARPSSNVSRRDIGLQGVGARSLTTGPLNGFARNSGATA